MVFQKVKGRGTNQKKEKIKVGKLRRGQFVGGAGTGAIVDMTRESVIMAGTDFWQHHQQGDYKVTEENLQKFLGVEYFVSPSVKREEGSGIPSYDIPAFRFPNWMFCPGCKRLAHESTFRFQKQPFCIKCEKELISSRFVVACKNGHLDDFPYVWWVHKGQEESKCSRPALRIYTNPDSSGLDSIVIHCTTCKETRSMAGSFGEKALEGFGCTRRRPWLQDVDHEHCDHTMRTLQRGATNLYFAINASALSIPPWSQKVQIELGNRWSSYKNYVDDPVLFRRVVEKDGLPQLCKCSAEEIYKQALLKQEYLESEERKTWKEILQDEYRAFLSGESDEDGEFKIREEPVPDFLKDYVESVVMASKLREVMALRGFKRIDPDYSDTDDRTFNHVSKQPMGWLPGIELRGEGIFIKINEDRLSEWESKYEERAAKIAERMKGSMVQKSNLSPRYILLHTLSHLLIRQLILQCGYSTASIKERIYATFPNEDGASIDMAGILIYTSSSDSEGSLGGLVREGEKDRLDNTFRQMLESASWCSSDPLCSQSDGQGLDSLNMAACHSCSLLPETSCEARNCFLDRVAVVGLLDDKSIGFFHEILEFDEVM